MDEPHNHPPKPNDTNPHENRDRLNSRKSSRKPGVDRSPRPTQKRPPPVNPTRSTGTIGFSQSVSQLFHGCVL